MTGELLVCIVDNFVIPGKENVIVFQGFGKNFLSIVKFLWYICDSCKEFNKYMNILVI